MSTRQLRIPREKQQADQVINHTQKRFDAGMYRDKPASDIPPNAVADIVNGHCYPEYTEGRTGTKLFSDADLPTLREGFAARKAGITVTIRSGGTVTEADIGRLFVWSDGDNDEIVGIVDSVTFQTRNTSTKSLMTGGKIRARVFGNFDHKILKKIVIHIDTRIFWADNTIKEYTEVFSMTGETPLAEQSRFQALDNYILMFQVGGIFKINVQSNRGYYYKANSSIPTNRLEREIETSVNKFCRRRIYTMSRILFLDHLEERSEPNKFFEQESGSVEVDENESDFGVTCQNLKSGPGTERKGVITGATSGTFSVATLVAGGESSFKIGFGTDTPVNVVVDLAGIESLAEAATRIENQMRSQFENPNLTFKYMITAAGTGFFEITTGDVDGQIFASQATAGTVGTNIATVLLLTVGDTATNTNEPFTAIDAVEVYRIPFVRNTNLKEKHWLYYSTYATLDVGPKGVSVEGIANDPQQFVWHSDIPVCKSVLGTWTSATNTLATTEGRFDNKDIGSTLVSESGFVGLITGITSQTSITVTMSAGANLTNEAFAIGLVNEPVGFAVGVKTGRAMTINKTLGIVTRASGDYFQSNDVGKLLFISNGEVLQITGYGNKNSVRVLEDTSSYSNAKGAALDPESRRLGDDVTDDRILDRLNGNLIRNRFWTELPSGNIGIVVPGFLCVAPPDSNSYFYSQLSDAFKYQGGYHNKALQFDEKTEDRIVLFRKYPDRLAVICTRSTFVTPTNIVNNQINQKFGTATAILPPLSLLDDKGVLHVGSVVPIEKGQDIMLTSEPAIRVFDGVSYSEPNFAELRVMRALRELSIDVFAHYDWDSGFILWGAKEL